MKITILSPDSSLKTLPRVKILYKLLEKHFEIEIISIVDKKEKEDYFKDEFPNYKSIKFDVNTVFKELMKKITGDIIYAVQAKASSFGLARNLKHYKKLPLVLDISSREIYSSYPYSKKLWINLIFSFLHFSDPNSFVYTWMLEKKIKTADIITTSSEKLKSVYGGKIIPHACDTDFFDPKLYKRNEIREYMKWSDSKVIIFAGNAKPHTGLENLVKAVKNIKDEKIVLAIVGKITPFYKRLSKMDSRIYLYDYQNSENIAKLLTASDLAVIPQRNLTMTEGKVPIKLFEAMSIGLPIISTDIFDISNILEDCGLISPVDDIKSLQENIEKLLNNNELSKKLGNKAREKCIKEYSLNAISMDLVETLEKLKTK